MLNVYDLDLDPGHYRADKDPGITGRIQDKNHFKVAVNIFQ